LNEKRSWEDEELFKIPEDIQKGIKEELGFLKPSYIQTIAIPLISQKSDDVYHSLIA